MGNGLVRTHNINSGCGVFHFVIGETFIAGCQLEGEPLNCFGLACLALVDWERQVEGVLLRIHSWGRK